MLQFITNRRVKRVKNYIDLDRFNKVPLKYEKFHAKEALATKLLDDYFRIKKRKKRMRHIFNLAAMLVLLMGISEFTYLISDVRVKTDMFVSGLTLPDGSEVIVMPHSEINYNSLLWNFSRNINLKGTAQFNVARDGGAFRVHTKMLDVEVLGTVFEIAEKENVTEVSCMEGKVLVMGKEIRQQLEAGMSVSVTKTGFEVSDTTSYDTQNKRHESADEIHIEGVTLKDLTSELSRVFDCAVELNVKDSNVLYSGTLYRYNRDLTLQLISSACGIKYKNENKTIVLY